MAMDMPPPRPAVEYRIEKPARAPEGTLKHVSTAIAQARAQAPRQPQALPETSRMLPPIDLRSAALTERDRRAMLAGSQASREGRGAQSVPAPASYVGDRVRLAAVRVRAMEASGQGRLVAADAHAARCRTVAVAMDRRAGAYVVGGERAAEEARRSIPRAVVEECRKVIAQRGRQPSPTELASVQRREPIRIDPQLAQRQPVSINPEVGRTQPVRIDPRLLQAGATRVDL